MCSAVEARISRVSTAVPMLCVHRSFHGSDRAVLVWNWASSSSTGVAIESSRIWRSPRKNTASSMLFTRADSPKYTEFTMRSRRADSEGSRRMISAIWEVTLLSERTSSLNARLMLESEASLGHDSMRCLISVSA